MASIASIWPIALISGNQAVREVTYYEISIINARAS